MRMQISNQATLAINLATYLVGAVTIGVAQAQPYKFDAADTALWDILKDNDNPEAFRSYLNIYPEGQFAGEARKRLEVTNTNPAGTDRIVEIEGRPKSVVVSIPEPPAYRRQGFLGVDVRAPGNAKENRYNQSQPKGVKVTGVSRNGPAAIAGVKTGDIITRANNRIIKSPDELVEMTSIMKPGENITIRLLRDRIGKEVSFPIGDRFGILWDEAHQGKPSSMYFLFFVFRDGNGPEKNIDAALRWLHKASEAGHARANYTLARRYQLGRDIGKDLPTALSLFEKAGDAGDGRGMYRAALMYRWGEGTKKNPALAAVWFRRAIDAGEPRALGGLADLYRLGNGTPKDYTRARKLYGKAVARNQRSAYLGLARMHLRGQGGPKDADRAVDLLLNAIRLGHTGSMVELGGLLVEGEQIKSDRTRGVKLLREAAAKGNKTSLRKLEDLGVPAYDPLELQQLLADAGFDPGPLDGKPGKKTRAAIRAFQEDATLKIDGEPSLEVLLALRKRLEPKANSD